MTKDPTNSFIELSLDKVYEVDYQDIFVHFFQWNFNSIWSKDIDEDDQNCEGCSQVNGFTVPENYNKEG